MESPIAVSLFCEDSSFDNRFLQIRCPLVTLRRGILRITGITLKLCGILEGYREIQLPQRRLNITAAHRKGFLCLFLCI